MRFGLLLVEDFCIHINQVNIPYFSWTVIVWFLHQSSSGLVKGSLSVFFFLVFLDQFKQDWQQSSSKCLVGLASETIWSQAFLCWKILTTDLISILIISLFWLSISSWLILGRLYVSRSSLSSRLIRLSMLSSCLCMSVTSCIVLFSHFRFICFELPLYFSWCSSEFHNSLYCLFKFCFNDFPIIFQWFFVCLFVSTLNLWWFTQYNNLQFRFFLFSNPLMYKVSFCTDTLLFECRFLSL